MYILQGQRIRLNKEIYREYDESDKAVAFFEYDVTKPVAQYLALYKKVGDSMEQIELYYRS